MVGPSDADWFCEQVEQLKPAMFRVAHAILHCEADCEDAAASAVLRAFRYLGSLQNRDGFRSWMLRILKNECFSIRRKRMLFDPLQDTEAVEPPMPDLDLQLAFRQLPANTRLALTLFYYEGYGVQEIAQIVGEPTGTIKSRLARGREQLRHKLEKGGRWA